MSIFKMYLRAFDLNAQRHMNLELQKVLLTKRGRKIKILTSTSILQVENAKFKPLVFARRILYEC